MFALATEGPQLASSCSPCEPFGLCRVPPAEHQCTTIRGSEDKGRKRRKQEGVTKRREKRKGRKEDGVTKRRKFRKGRKEERRKREKCHAWVKFS